MCDVLPICRDRDICDELLVENQYCPNYYPINYTNNYQKNNQIHNYTNELDIIMCPDDDDYDYDSMFS